MMFSAEGTTSYYLQFIHADLFDMEYPCIEFLRKVPVKIQPDSLTRLRSFRSNHTIDILGTDSILYMIVES